MFHFEGKKCLAVKENTILVVSATGKNFVSGIIKFHFALSTHQSALNPYIVVIINLIKKSVLINLIKFSTKK